MITKEQSKRREEWQKYIEAWEASGVKQIDFCKQHNICSGKFSYYKNLLKPKQTEYAKFTPIKITAPSSAIDIRITLPNGFSVYFPCRLDKEKLKGFIEVLLSC
jgi:hypothetical protein